ncbi:hypothetical protein [Mucilaginibacter aquatilis]|uniref:Aerotolerance regulator N-terminal domain-containing protein n=1 Tax=Mucilaginibacter aquatilis TaxID=1517760 RepID=A0A6I4I6W9_9SPHI|nr:hypothetical protein [Mucilaginibacter aquatilis]MVN90910.1 hypothetical protein [Mucilaginibacter aquatilis]
MSWTLTVIIICLLLLLLFTWQEFSRADKRRLIWRIIALWLAVGALACIILPLSYTTQTNISDGTKAVLLTKGFDINSIPAKVAVFTIDKAIQQKYPKAKLIGSTEELTYSKPLITHLQILGHGLNKYELEPLSKLHVSFNAPEPATGYTSVNWPAKIKAGNIFPLQGSYLNKSKKPVKLLLKGLNTSLDSTSIAPGTSSFQLNTTPKLKGPVVYHLLALSGYDTLSNDAVPIQILPTQPVKVLLLNAAPNFENRFLKNWLGENGYAVASRATISKDKSSTEFVNMDKLNLQRIDAGILNRFDLVVGDLSTLKTLSPAESSALRNEVTQKGLGVIVKADSSDNVPTWLQHDFPVNTLGLKEQPSVALTLQGKATKTAKLNIEASYVSYRNNTQTLVADAQNHGLAATNIAGSGNIIFTTLNHTYAWLLTGNKNDYAALWSLLISKAAKQSSPAYSWKVITPVPNIEQPVNFICSGATSEAAVSVNSEKLSPFQSSILPYQWKIHYNTLTKGWQQTNFGSKGEDWMYIYDAKHWNGIKNLIKINETKEYATKSIQKLSVTKQIQQKTQSEVPKVWFYIILLLACTFLWIERKFSIQL